MGHAVRAQWYCVAQNATFTCSLLTLTTFQLFANALMLSSSYIDVHAPESGFTPS